MKIQKERRKEGKEGREGGREEGREEGREGKREGRRKEALQLRRSFQNQRKLRCTARALWVNRMWTSVCRRVGVKTLPFCFLTEREHYLSCVL